MVSWSVSLMVLNLDPATAPFFFLSFFFRYIENKKKVEIKREQLVINMLVVKIMVAASG